MVTNFHHQISYYLKANSVDSQFAQTMRERPEKIQKTTKTLLKSVSIASSNTYLELF